MQGKWQNSGKGVKIWSFAQTDVCVTTMHENSLGGRGPPGPAEDLTALLQRGCM